MPSRRSRRTRLASPPPTMPEYAGSIEMNSPTGRFPQEVMDLIYENLLSDIKVKPQPNASRNSLIQAGLGFLFVNKTQSEALQTVMYKRAQISLPTDVSVVQLLRSKARLQGIQHIIIPCQRGHESVWWTSDQEASHLLFKLLFGALRGIRTLEMVELTGAWKKRHRRICPDAFTSTVTQSVEDILLSSMDLNTAAQISTQPPSICCYDFVSQIQKWFKKCPMTSSSLVLSIRCQTAKTKPPSFNRQLIAGVPKYSQRLTGFNTSTRHELKSWTATGHYRRVQLHVQGCLDNLNRRWRRRSFMQPDRAEPGKGFEPAFGLFHHVFLRAPTDEECVRLCYDNFRTPHLSRTTPALREGAIRDYCHVLGAVISGKINGYLDKHESYRLWSVCLNHSAQTVHAQNWEEAYDFAQHVSDDGRMTSQQKHAFFMKLFGRPKGH